MRQYWQVRANISGLQKLSTISLSQVCVDNFWFLKDETKEHCPVVELFFCCCFFFSATLFVSASQPESLCKQQKTWWYGRHQQLLPLNTNRHRVLPPHSTFCFRESMENLLSNGSLQHHQFFFVSEPHDSTKHSLLYSKNNSFCTYSYMCFEWGGASWFKKKKILSSGKMIYTGTAHIYILYIWRSLSTM